jgi:hypothetical protein
MRLKYAPFALEMAAGAAGMERSMISALYAKASAPYSLLKPPKSALFAPAMGVDYAGMGTRMIFALFVKDQVGLTFSKKTSN